MKTNVRNHYLGTVEVKGRNFHMFEDTLSSQYDIFSDYLFSYRVVANNVDFEKMEKFLSRSGDFKSFLHFESQKSNIPLVLMRENPKLTWELSEDEVLSGNFKEKDLNSEIKRWLSFWPEEHHWVSCEISFNALAIFALFNRLFDFDSNCDLEKHTVETFYEEVRRGKYQEVINLAREDFQTLSFSEFSYSLNLTRYILHCLFPKNFYLLGLLPPVLSLKDLISPSLVNRDQTRATISVSSFNFGTLKKMVSMHKKIVKDVPFDREKTEREEIKSHNLHLDFLYHFTESEFFNDIRFLSSLQSNCNKLENFKDLGFVFALTFVDMLAQENTVDMLKNKLLDEFLYSENRVELLDFNCIAECSKKFIECNGKTPFSMLTNITYGV